MSVLLETSLGDIIIDLETEKTPKCALNFLKLCKTKYYNFCVFHCVQKGFVCQAGDPCGSGEGGESVWGLINGPTNKYFEPEIHPSLKHDSKGTVSMALVEHQGRFMAGSQFLITLSDSPLEYLDGKQAVFGRVVEGLDVLDKFNGVVCDDASRPFRDIRIKHTIILDDEFDDPVGLIVPPSSPLPTEAQLKSMRIGEDEALETAIGSTEQTNHDRQKESESRALTLEMIGDLPFAEIKPPENVLFVCKLNPVTRDEDLCVIFSRFGSILSCEVIRDRKSGESLCYAFIEFEEPQGCEEAYFKMDNVLIDDRRIHVDFSQSVSKLHFDFMAGKRNTLESYGGIGLQKRSKYRGGDGGARKPSEQYDMVFEQPPRSSSRANGDDDERRYSNRETRKRRDREEGEEGEGEKVGGRISGRWNERRSNAYRDGRDDRDSHLRDRRRDDGQQFESRRSSDDYRDGRSREHYSSQRSRDDGYRYNRDGYQRGLSPPPSRNVRPKPDK